MDAELQYQLICRQLADAHDAAARERLVRRPRPVSVVPPAAPRTDAGPHVGWLARLIGLAGNGSR